MKRKVEKVSGATLSEAAFQVIKRAGKGGAPESADYHDR